MLSSDDSVIARLVLSVGADCVNAGFEGLNGEADVAAVSHGAALRINEVLGVAVVAEQGECAARVVVRIDEQNYEASDDVVHVMISKDGT